MSDIFICYSRTDSAIATRLAERLRAEGWSVFLDVQTHVGKRWHKEIEKELYAAKALVALWSTRSRESDFVLEEAEYGKRKGILFPAFIESMEFPYGFGRIQTAKLINWTGVPDHPGLEQLLESLRLQLNSHETHPSPGNEQATDPARQPALGKTFRDPLKIGGEGPLMVVIPPGRFLMGSPPEEPERSGNEDPQHAVRIAQPYALGVYAVTFDEYDCFAQAAQRRRPEDQGWGRDKRPVINVSWGDAQAYCAWLSAQTGRAYRLPSEAEWEFACRAGTTTSFYTGERISTDQANFDGNYTYNGSTKGVYRQQTLPVGSFPPNAFGLYDMHGNVWEWCQDRWHDSYDGAPRDGSSWDSGDEGGRVLRGGSWTFFSRSCRAASRSSSAPDSCFVNFSFRVCCSAPIE